MPSTLREKCFCNLGIAVSVITQNADVLAKTTVSEWDTKTISTPLHITGVLVLCAAFWPDVKKHYEELRYHAIQPESALTEQQTKSA